MDSYVAFLDILGFSNLILSGDFAGKFDQYSKILENSLKDENALSYITFSDSLIINTETDEIEELISLASAVSKLSFSLMIEMGIPLCGCISVGDLTRYESKGNVMIAGSPIIDAFEYEKLQDWVGVMFSPKVVIQHPEIDTLTFLSSGSRHEVLLYNFRWSSTVNRYDEIPLNGLDYDGFAIIPRNAESTKINQWLNDLVDYSYELDKLKLCAPNPSIQMKFTRARQFIESVHHKWYLITQSKKWEEFIKSVGDIDHFSAPFLSKK